MHETSNNFVAEVNFVFQHCENFVYSFECDATSIRPTNSQCGAIHGFEAQFLNIASLNCGENGQINSEELELMRYFHRICSNHICGFDLVENKLYLKIA